VTNQANINSEITGTGNEKNVKGESLLQLVCFKVDNELFGLEILKIQEIIRLPDITRLPKAPAFIKGVINLRGNIIPVVDLREKLGLAERKTSKMTRAIVVENEHKKIAVIVDEVANVLRVKGGAVSSAPAFVSKVAEEYIDGVVEYEQQLVIILRIDKILSSEDIISIEKAGK